MTKKFTSVYRNDATMFWHFGLFLAATTIALISSVLTEIANQIVKEEKYENATCIRLKIAAVDFSIVEEVLWFLTLIIMLLVFIKYGKPLEDNTQTLIRTKLQELMIKD